METTETPANEVTAAPENSERQPQPWEPMPEVWDARAELDVGLMMLRYLADHPAPAGTKLAADLETWGSSLARDGDERLRAAGQRRVRPVPRLG
jgi:hypothetical protein